MQHSGQGALDQQPKMLHMSFEKNAAWPHIERNDQPLIQEIGFSTLGLSEGIPEVWAQAAEGLVIDAIFKIMDPQQSRNEHHKVTGVASGQSLEITRETGPLAHWVQASIKQSLH